MVDFSNEYFERLKQRCVNLQIQKYNFEHNKARDQKFSKQFYTLLYTAFEGIEYDDFSKEMAEEFDLRYKLGQNIMEIIDFIQDKIVTAEKYKKSDERFFETKYYKFLWLFKSTFPKRKTVTDSEGKIISQIDYDYDFSLKHWIRLGKAKTEEEKNEIYYNQIQKKHITIVEGIPLTLSFINPDKYDKKSIFKDLVRYQVIKHFQDYVKAQAPLPEIDGKGMLKTTSDITAIPSDQSKVNDSGIHWTNAGNNIDFVKLIYAMHHAGLINDGNGEVTKIVDYLSVVFNMNMSKSWQSNFSKNKNDQNTDYDHLAIFDKLKAAYSGYLDKKTK